MKRLDHVTYYERQYRTTYYVYIVSNNLRNVLEVDITMDLQDSLQNLKCREALEARRYLVYWESYSEALKGVKREMKLATFSQKKLRQLVLKQNPELQFLNETFVSQTNGYK